MSAVVRLDVGPAAMASAHAALAAESVYGELLDHAYACGHCWPWREALWRADRLCAAGRELVDAYAAAVVHACSGDEGDADAALAVRLRDESPPRLVALPGGRHGA